MREFFRGWKRKTGVVTLVMACVFMIGWIRSLTVVDFIKFPTAEKSWQEWAIGGGSIRAWMLNSKSAPRERIPRSFGWRKVHISAIRWMNGDEQLWRWSNEYFPPGTGWEFEGNVHSNLIVPCWAIVIPLIALSAYLLISKPLPTKSSTTEPRAAPI